MSTTDDKYREDLTAYLLDVATGNGYPEYCLACAGYLGMAVAHLWDKDWPKAWGGPYQGIWYMSRDFIALNTTYIFLNRNALPKKLLS